MIEGGISNIVKENINKVLPTCTSNSKWTGLTHKIRKGLRVIMENLLVQACLRAPHVVADEAKLAIVFTYFFLSFFLFSFSPTPSAFHPLRGISRA